MAFETYSNEIKNIPNIYEESDEDKFTCCNDQSATEEVMKISKRDVTNALRGRRALVFRWVFKTKFMENF